MADPTPEEITAFLARTDPNKVGRLDEPPPAFAAQRSFTLRRAKPTDMPPTRPTAAQWQAYAQANAADPACAGAPIAMTVDRDPAEGVTVVTYYWSA